jgi:carbon-monoxide dehydrogenase small subunit
MSSHEITLHINGERVDCQVESRMLLVHLLRNQLGLTGTHVGCDTTQCGACTISLDNQAVKSCTILAVQADGGHIVTIEGMAQDDKLHPIQEAFSIEHGLQCGFCTPGMVMSACQLIARYPEADAQEIRHQLEGNICRCTGYHNIVKAVQRAAEVARSSAGSSDIPPRAFPKHEGQSPTDLHQRRFSAL